MEEKTTKGLKEQRERRKRINCMKMGIITSIFVWMLISIILCVVLLCRVISLQNQIDRLVSSGIVSGQVQQDENQSKGEMSTGTELQTDTEYHPQNFQANRKSHCIYGNKNAFPVCAPHLQFFYTSPGTLHLILTGM